MTLSLAGCITNDLPYPVVVPHVTSMEVDGAKNVNIDYANQVITIYLEEGEKELWPDIEETDEDTADILFNVEEIDVIMAFEAMLDPVSIYTPIYSSGGDEIYLMDQIESEEYDENKRINSLIRLNLL